MVKEARETLEKVAKEDWWDWSGRVQKSILEMGRGGRGKEMNVES